MSQAAPAFPSRDIEMVSAMVEGAFALGMSALEMAKGCQDTKTFCEVSAEYRHCAFAVRMGIRLKLKLAAARPVAARAKPPVEREAEAIERPERDRREHDPPEREYDREREPVSLPAFLRSLGVVVRNAERRVDRLPPQLATETLPRLRGLLAEANAEAPSAPSRGVKVMERPQNPPATTRSRLLGSAAAPPRGPPRRSSA